MVAAGSPLRRCTTVQGGACFGIFLVVMLHSRHIVTETGSLETSAAGHGHKNLEGQVASYTQRW